MNGFVAYGGTAVVGSDAGWWIPLLASRANTVPPLTYVAERPEDPTYVEQVRNDLLYLEQVSPTSEEGVRFLQETGVTHVYVGVREGGVGDPDEPLLDVRALSAHPAFRIVYNWEGVRIYELVSPEPA